MQEASSGQGCSENLTLFIAKISDGATASLVAKKLHRQFAHATAEKLISTLKNSNSSWKDDPNLRKKLVEVVDNCQTCQLYRKPPARPVVGLPLATKFQETVAMDLKFYDGHILLHMIDQIMQLVFHNRSG